MKNLTVRFYAKIEENEEYLGIEYVGFKYMKNCTYRELRSWLSSGNYLKIGKKHYNCFSELLLHFKNLK